MLIIGPDWWISNPRTMMTAENRERDCRDGQDGGEHAQIFNRTLETKTRFSATEWWRMRQSLTGLPAVNSLFRQERRITQHAVLVVLTNGSLWRRRLLARNAAMVSGDVW